MGLVRVVRLGARERKYEEGEGGGEGQVGTKDGSQSP